MPARTSSVHPTGGHGAPGGFATTRHRVAIDPNGPVPDRAAAEAYVASVCFKHGPPRLVGTELEWLVRHDDDPTRPVDPDRLARALGPHAPATLSPHPPSNGSGPAPLPAGGVITVEPGGQVEIASPPLPGLGALVRAVRADHAALRGLLATERLTTVPRAGDALRPPRRVLQVPRYAAMEATFDRIGPHGRTMMCSTTAVQVCVDAGEGEEVARRWAALHELGPVLLAAFANSPAVHGRRTGWKSSRWAAWMALDPERTGPPRVLGPDPAAEYARRAVDTRLLCVRREDGDGDSWAAPDATFAQWVDGALAPPPTRADLDYHLTTLFPPVRPQGHLEVRYLDQQAGDEWVVPLVVVAALMHDPDTVARARAAAEPAVGRWAAAARHGLADRVLRRAAGDVFEQAHRTLAGPAFADLPPDVRELVDRVITERVLRGRSPADEPLDPAETFLPPDPVPVIPDELDDQIAPDRPDTPEGVRSLQRGERP
ncbi:ergothioneine biosynthesis glutamate--cysteine ligase EgtA [Actinomycetospora lemnae]|uniref:Glutamate--cysteine ligase EgtA n=1 Tax=Actinomycetospora lemnae TaxID=3019891 RepID=A0ABT5SQC1_9PSEU|nr:ergothioneine biosynthesis glutamate--cysteine ligase EgtA [Actinomycetospora sp. DW7H6]MDD7964670.1 ergothioneine biosynthesis glutamate--cysteine ligase EgtA [Actinomycetospora sp. DW7H6]